MINVFRKLTVPKIFQDAYNALKIGKILMYVKVTKCFWKTSLKESAMVFFANTV